MNNISTSNRIKELCKANKTPIKTVLESCYINRNFIYDLEHSKISPSVDKIESIADHFNVSIDYLMCRTDNPDINK